MPEKAFLLSKIKCFATDNKKEYNVVLVIYDLHPSISFLCSIDVRTHDRQRVVYRIAAIFTVWNFQVLDQTYPIFSSRAMLIFLASFGLNCHQI